MNTNHQINLARNFVWDARQRRTVYCTMFVYLMISCAVLVFGVNRATYKIQSGQAFYREAQSLQQRFRNRYPDQTDMETYAGQMKASLQKKALQADSINTALPGAIHSIQPLLNQLANRTQSGSIYKLSFEQQGKDGGKPELTFGIMVPEDSGDSVAETPASLQQWRKDPILADEFTAITPTTTERGNAGNTAISILKYKAIFKEH